MIPLGLFQRSYMARGPALLPLCLGVSAVDASAQLTTAHGHWDTSAELALGMFASAVGFLRLLILHTLVERDARGCWCGSGRGGERLTLSVFIRRSSVPSTFYAPSA